MKKQVKNKSLNIMINIKVHQFTKWCHLKIVKFVEFHYLSWRHLKVLLKHDSNSHKKLGQVSVEMFFMQRSLEASQPMKNA